MKGSPKEEEVSRQLSVELKGGVAVVEVMERGKGGGGAAADKEGRVRHSV